MEQNILDINEQYDQEIFQLTNITWRSIFLQKKEIPIWFQNILKKRSSGMLQLLFFSSYPWVVFPDFSYNYSIVAFNKNKGKLQRPNTIQYRHYQGSEPKNTENILKTSISKLCDHVIEFDYNMLKIEDNNFLILIFNNSMLYDSLTLLGFPKEEILNKSLINKKSVNWDKIEL